MRIMRYDVMVVMVMTVNCSGDDDVGAGVVCIFLAAFLYFPGFRGSLHFPLLPCGLFYFPGT